MITYARTLEAETTFRSELLMENRFELIEDELPLPSVGNLTLINARELTWEDLNTLLHKIFGYDNRFNDFSDIDVVVQARSEVIAWTKVPENEAFTNLARLWIEKFEQFLPGHTEVYLMAFNLDNCIKCC